jgi:hypothetical protein
MKKVILLVAAMALMAGAVNAGPIAYIGLYTDANHAICSQAIPAPYMGFTTWIWVLPSDNGMMCAEFKLVAPAWLLSIGTTVNPAYSVALGAPYDAGGVSICFGACQNAWTWLYQLSQLPTAAGVPGYIEIVARPDAGAYQVANCLPKYPLEPLTILNYLALNQECIFANEDASWGAIKGMYNE